MKIKVNFIILIYVAFFISNANAAIVIPPQPAIRSHEPIQGYFDGVLWCRPYKIGDDLHQGCQVPGRSSSYISIENYLKLRVPNAIITGITYEPSYDSFYIYYKLSNKQA